MERLTVGIDGNCIYVGLGDLPTGDFLFKELEEGPEAMNPREQSRNLIEDWYQKYPQHGRLPFDWVDGL